MVVINYYIFRVIILIYIYDDYMVIYLCFIVHSLQYEGRAIGLMTLTSTFNLRSLQDNFNLEDFDGFLNDEGGLIFPLCICFCFIVL
jgi:hypothetical protein